MGGEGGEGTEGKATPTSKRWTKGLPPPPSPLRARDRGPPTAARCVAAPQPSIPACLTVRLATPATRVAGHRCYDRNTNASRRTSTPAATTAATPASARRLARQGPTGAWLFRAWREWTGVKESNKIRWGLPGKGRLAPFREYTQAPRAAVTGVSGSHGGSDAGIVRAARAPSRHRDDRPNSNTIHARTTTATV